MPETVLPIFLDGCTPISSFVCYERRDGMIHYFHGTLPVFSHAEDDRQSFKMFTSQLVANGQCKNAELQRAFGITKISVCRALKKFKEGGCHAFYEKKKTRGASLLTPKVLKDAQELFDKGVGRSEVADRLGIKRDTLRKAINNGKLHESSPKKGI